MTGSNSKRVWMFATSVLLLGGLAHAQQPEPPGLSSGLKIVDAENKTVGIFVGDAIRLIGEEWFELIGVFSYGFDSQGQVTLRYTSTDCTGQAYGEFDPHLPVLPPYAGN